MELPLPEALITYGHVLDGANRSLSDAFLAVGEDRVWSNIIDA